MSINVEFQKRFIELVDEADCIKSELPKLIGINYSTFTKIFKYGEVPMAKTLVKVADYFNISIEYLLGRTADEYFDKSTNTKTFHEILDSLREDKKITYYELGKEVLLHPNFFSEWKKHKHIPSIDNLIILAEYFKVSIDYLLGRTDDKQI